MENLVSLRDGQVEALRLMGAAGEGGAWVHLWVQLRDAGAGKATTRVASAPPRSGGHSPCEPGEPNRVGDPKKHESFAPRVRPRGVTIQVHEGNLCCRRSGSPDRHAESLTLVSESLFRSGESVRVAISRRTVREANTYVAVYSYVRFSEAPESENARLGKFF